MNPRQTDRKLRLELLRARAAADRIELALAVNDLAERLAPLRRAWDSLGTIAGVLGRGRTLGWLLAGAAAWARTRGMRRALRAAAGAGHGMGRVAFSALLAAAIALVVRALRRSEGGQDDPGAGGGDETAGGH